MDLSKNHIDLSIEECVDRLEFFLDAEFFNGYELVINQFNSCLYSLTRNYVSQVSRFKEAGMADKFGVLESRKHTLNYTLGYGENDIPSMRASCEGLRKFLAVLDPILLGCNRNLFIERKSETNMMPTINGQSLIRAYGNFKIEVLWGRDRGDAILHTAYLRDLNWTQEGISEVLAYRVVEDIFSSKGNF